VTVAFVRAWLVVHCISLALVTSLNCSWFKVESHCWFLVSGSWMVRTVAGREFSAVLDIQLGVRESGPLFIVGLLLGSCYEGSCRI
jgi:hypothetical protein